MRIRRGLLSRGWIHLWRPIEIGHSRIVADVTRAQHRETEPQRPAHGRRAVLIRDHQPTEQAGDAAALIKPQETVERPIPPHKLPHLLGRFKEPVVATRVAPPALGLVGSLHEMPFHPEENWVGE